jgi:hypothetical protein
VPQVCSYSFSFLFIWSVRWLASLYYYELLVYYFPLRRNISLKKFLFFIIFFLILLVCGFCNGIFFVSLSNDFFFLLFYLPGRFLTPSTSLRYLHSIKRLIKLVGGWEERIVTFLLFTILLLLKNTFYQTIKKKKSVLFPQFNLFRSISIFFPSV